MELRTHFFILLLPSLILAMDRGQDKLWLSLYYESLCPDSVQLIQQQLAPLCSKLCDYIHLDLIPFSQVTKQRNGLLTFTCQHGEEECLGNKLHACAIEKLPQNLALDFINCTISTNPSSPGSTGQICARNLNVSQFYLAINYCVTNEEAEKLLERNAERTTSFQPAIHNFPTIALNGTVSKDTENLLNVVCNKLNTTGLNPPSCHVV